MQENENIESVAVPLSLIMGYEEFDDISSPETRSTETIQTFLHPLDSTKDNGIDIVTTIELLPMEKPIQTRANMNNGSRFRMLIYDGAGNQVADNQYQVNGTTATLVTGTAPMLVPGTYKFVSYTRNATTLPDSSNVVTAKNGDDFATFCISKNISAADNSIMIVFKRQISQFQVAVSAFGFSNNTIIYDSAVVSNIYSDGTWNVNSTSSDDTNLVLSGTASITCYNDNQYKILPVSRTLTISFANLNIGSVDFGSQSVSLPATFSRKGNYKITVEFNKSDKYILVGGVKWAPGNLYVQGGVYAFENRQQDYHTGMNGGSYFPWNSLSIVPNTANMTNVYDYKKDPCSKVAPAGKWQTPTYQQIVALNSNYTKSVSDPAGAWYGGVNTGVFLPANGYYTSSGTIQAFGQGCYSWSSHVNTANNNPYYILGTPTTSIIANNPSRIDPTPIRCVMR